MGTNYYAIPQFTREDKQELLEQINKQNWDKARELIPKDIHIGKSSCGWEFCFNHNNWQYFDKTLESFKEFLRKHTIRDEYNRDVSYDEFWEVVHNRGDNPINGKEYYTNWKKYNIDLNGNPRPFDSWMLENAIRENYHEEYHFGYRFSTSTEFC